MMSKAIIVFANGSKEMAHNLDDQRLRWYERKLLVAQEIRGYHNAGITIRDCSLPKDRDQARVWQSELKSQLSALTQQLIILGASYRNKALMHQGTIQFRLAVQEIQGQLGAVKAYLRECAEKELESSTDPDDHKIRKAQLLEKLVDAQEEIIRLQRLLIDQFGLSGDVVYEDKAS